MFWVTAGYHRYFSHRSYKTSRVFQFVIAFMAMTSTQKGVLWWAAHHRHHHRFSDQDDDIHSPTLFGFFWAHIGWIVSDRYNDTRAQLHRRLRQISRAPLAQQIPFHSADDPRRQLLSDRRPPALPLGLLPQHRAALARHVHDQFALASVRHRPLRDDRYQQEQLVPRAAHARRRLAQQPSPLTWPSARQGFFWWEIDITYYTLKLFSWLGLVWDLRQVPAHLLHSDERRRPNSPLNKFITQ